MKRDELIATIFENTQTIKRVMYGQSQLRLKGVALSHAQVELLFTIKHLQPVSFKDLASRLYLTRGAVSQLVEGLSNESLVVREVDTTDRRMQHLRISGKGTRLIDKIETERWRTMEAVMQKLQTDELAVWARVQQKLIDTFANQPVENSTRKQGTK